LDDIPNNIGNGACCVIHNQLNEVDVLVSDRPASYFFKLRDETWREGPHLPSLERNAFSSLDSYGFLAIGGLQNN